VALAACSLVHLLHRAQLRAQLRRKAEAAEAAEGAAAGGQDRDRLLRRLRAHAAAARLHVQGGLGRHTVGDAPGTELHRYANANAARPT
jgi:hypothetical protein